MSPLMFRLPVLKLRSTASGTTPPAAAALPLAAAHLTRAPDVALTRAPDVALTRAPGAALTHDHADTCGCLPGPAAIAAIAAAVATSACAIHPFCTPEPVFTLWAAKPVFA
ncbi:MAG: hypothetical protein EOM72_01355 [Opitutae bacterium]|nr:hypothetical protein [Opitutae bacterium]